MDKKRLPEDIQALNARILASPELIENIGPIHVLTVVGRTSGKPRTIPVSAVRYAGHRWLIAGWPDADWVKNLRENSSAALTKGSKVEHIRAVEVSAEQGAPGLRAFVQERSGAHTPSAWTQTRPPKSLSPRSPATRSFRSWTEST